MPTGCGRHSSAGMERLLVAWHSGAGTFRGLHIPPANPRLRGVRRAGLRSSPGPSAECGGDGVLVWVLVPWAGGYVFMPLFRV